MKKFIFLILFSTLTNLAMTEDEQALFAAASRGDIDTIDRLLKQGVDVNARDDVNAQDYAIGQTPLHAAAKANSKRSVIYLLAHGADPNAKDQCMIDPLGFATDPQIEDILNEDDPNQFCRDLLNK